ncbi:MAG: integrase family protein [Rhodanobacter sp.]
MAVKLNFTKEFCEGLAFDAMVVGVAKNGHVKVQRDHGKHNWIVRDTGQSGLYLRLTPGTTSWYVQRKVAGQPWQRKIGHFWAANSNEPTMSLKAARDEAALWLGQIVGGTDLAVARKQLQLTSKEARQRDRFTVGVAYEVWVEEEAESGAAPGTTTDRKKVTNWMNRSPVWSVPVADVTVDHVKASIGPILDQAIGKLTRRPAWGGPKSVSTGTLNKIYNYMSGAWAAAAEKIGMDGADKGPFKIWRGKQKNWPSPTERETFLDTETDEGVAWLKALVELQEKAHDPAVLTQKQGQHEKGLSPHTSVLIDLYILILIWGSRKTETALLEWRDIDFDKRMIILRGETTKNKKADTIPLTTWATEILHKRREHYQRWRPDEPTPYVFPSRRRLLLDDGTKVSRPISNPRSILVTLREETGLMINAHDLRRTMATELIQSDDIDKAVQELVLAGAVLHHTNRKGGITSASTARYLMRKANSLRKSYQQREDKLRRLAGLPVDVQEAPPEEERRKDREALLELVRTEPAFRRELMEDLLR